MKMPGYIKDCFVLSRPGEQLFDADGLPTMNGYAIIPMEVFDAMGGRQHAAARLVTSSTDTTQ